MAAMLEGWDIVCFSTTDWDFPWGSRQQLMSRFAASNRVLFIEYQGSFVQDWSGRCGVRSPSAAMPGRVRAVTPRLSVWRPPGAWPGGYYSLAVNRANQAKLRRGLSSVLKDLGFCRLLLWVYAPCSLEQIGNLAEQGAVYHAIDLYKEETGHPRRRTVIQAMEQQGAPKADLVIASSPPIQDHLRPWAKALTLQPSATDAAEEPQPTRRQRWNWPGKVAGFVGTVDDRVDMNLLERLAAAYPEVLWAAVGPVVGQARQERLDRLAARPNVRLVGRVDRADVPGYIESLDVCLLPYRRTPFTDAISPIKVYEYLLQGKPVVASRLGGLAGMENLVALAPSPEAFESLVARALEAPDNGARPRRIDFARQHTWDHRFQAISAEVAARLPQRAPGS